MRDQQKERLWRIRQEIMNLVAEAANLIGQNPLDLSIKDESSGHLECQASIQREDGLNRVLKFEQVWHGKDESRHFLNVGVVVLTANEK